MSFPESMTPKDVAWSITAALQALLGGPTAMTFVREDPFKPNTGRFDLPAALKEAEALAEKVAQRGEELCTMHLLLRPGANMAELIKQAEARELRRVRALPKEKPEGEEAP